ncbi:hypothetical protein QQZ08_008515 [Neonectria magnoliae]|uniref:Amine oxidase domain-containing protein n=1 Tax=Neonectria magnoliae TaxID=2732573 RepID=A0ABR1HTT2_9HYPO
MDPSSATSPTADWREGAHQEALQPQTPPHRPLKAPGQPPSRVAIIGTGLSGLTSAYLLHHDCQERYAVTLFEQVLATLKPQRLNASAASLSFDSASVAVKNTKTGITERIDLPMRASAGGYYDNLLRMYHHLRIPLHPIQFLFVFAKALATTDSPSKLRIDSTDRQHATAASGTYFVHASNLHQMPPPWPGSRGFVAHVIEILYLILCHFWFSVACFVVQPLEGSEPFADYLRRLRLPRRYISHYLLPLISSVSTCSHDELLAFPASDIVNYKKMSYGQQHYTVCGGVSQVQSRLAQGIEDVRLNTRVVEVVPGTNQSGVTICWQLTTGSTQVEEEVFDRVVLAVSPDVVGSIFRPLRSAMNKMPTLCVESSVLSPERVQLEPGTFAIDDNAVQEPLNGSFAHHARRRRRQHLPTRRNTRVEKNPADSQVHENVANYR